KKIAQIGPIQGVHPIANAKPIINVTINPEGLFLNLINRSFIKNSKFNTPTITKQKKIITIAPICLIKSWYINKYFENAFDEKPNITNTNENSNKKITI